MILIYGLTKAFKFLYNNIIFSKLKSAIIINLIKSYKKGYKSCNNNIIIIDIKLLKSFVTALIIISLLIIYLKIFSIVIIKDYKNNLIFS